MRLSEFMLSNREAILAEWVEFARSCSPIAVTMDLAVLRDHGEQILETIAADLSTRQSKTEQADKSKGKRDAQDKPGADETAAQTHGAARAESGFSVGQMVSEYRALRASVLRLWLEAAGALTSASDFDDLIRFNEAIDQAVAESIVSHSQDLERSKDMFLAMLGHDLRTPLGAILGAARVISAADDPARTAPKMAALVVRSGERMNAMVRDLLDFTRSRLGSGIPIAPSETDLEKLCAQTVEEIAALYPGRVVQREASGELRGMWDGARLSQALSNIVTNAIEHGSDERPVGVTVHGDADEIILSVHNWGPVIPRNQLKKIFDPLHRIEGDKPAPPRTNLGLGLYIADRIVHAHGGTIVVESSEQQGTTFTMHVPRHALGRLSAA